MRASQYYVGTLKEAPQEAELASHKLMLRAGLIRRLGSGLYTWMPLGLRVVRRVEQAGLIDHAGFGLADSIRSTNCATETNVAPPRLATRWRACTKPRTPLSVSKTIVWPIWLRRKLVFIRLLRLPT